MWQERPASLLQKPDIYGGKICAAVDRQHPRDLFDIKMLLESGDMSREIFEGFLVYLISNGRPISELLKPKFMTDQDKQFLLSVKRGRPKWELFPISGIEQLPSVQWKLMNIERMPDAKHKKSLAKLEEVLSRM